MIPLYATVPQSQADAILAGEIPSSLAQLSHRFSLVSESTIELRSSLTPPMSSQEQCLEITLDVPEVLLLEHRYDILDASDTTYVVPRSWLERAQFRRVPDHEILAFCREHLDFPVLPLSTPLRFYLERAMKSGDTARISPFYIQAIHETKA